MARRKTLPDSVRAKFTLAERLRSLRSELYGERGGPELARQLGLPVRTWYNYESGVTVPAEVILKIIELTSVEPIWLLRGEGEKFRTPGRHAGESAAGQGVSVGSLLRKALHMLEQGESAPQAVVISRAVPGAEDAVGDADVVLLDVEPAGRLVSESCGPQYLAAKREWVDDGRESSCIRISGDAMSPIVADGACVAFDKAEEAPADLDGKMVVAWVDDRPVVRWFQFCGRYGVLRAENPAADPVTILIDLNDEARPPRFRRVLWINTPH